MTKIMLSTCRRERGKIKKQKKQNAFQKIAMKKSATVIDANICDGGV